MLFPYIADISGCEEMLAVKRETKTFLPFHNNCLFNRNELATDNCVVGGSLLTDNLNLLKRVAAGSTAAGDYLQSKSIYPIPPVLHKFPFNGLHSSIGIYTIFRLELLYSLSLKNSKIAQRVLILLLVRSATNFKCNALLLLATIAISKKSNLENAE